MSDLLSTGQMIDKLQVGQIAETARIKAEWVTKTENGFYWCDSKGKPFTCDKLVINQVVSDMKWEVLPEYVSFDKAMEALKQGKKVKFNSGNWFDKSDNLEDSIGYVYTSWVEILSDKWVIED